MFGPQDLAVLARTAGRNQQCPCCWHHQACWIATPQNQKGCPRLRQSPASWTSALPMSPSQPSCPEAYQTPRFRLCPPCAKPIGDLLLLQLLPLLSSLNPSFRLKLQSRKLHRNALGVAPLSAQEPSCWQSPSGSSEEVARASCQVRMVRSDYSLVWQDMDLCTVEVHYQFILGFEFWLKYSSYDDKVQTVSLPAASPLKPVTLSPTNLKLFFLFLLSMQYGCYHVKDCSENCNRPGKANFKLNENQSATLILEWATSEHDQLYSTVHALCYLCLYMEHSTKKVQIERTWMATIQQPIWCSVCW